MKNFCYIISAAIALILSSCGDKNNDTELTNSKASLPASFKFATMGLKVMSSSMNKKTGTMSTLYGNLLAKKNAGGKKHILVPGEVLALVTWKQQKDEHWFGANIPGDLQAVEIIKTTAGKAGAAINYQEFLGQKLQLNPDTINQQAHIKHIFGMEPSLMP
jgi:hypothetical protein